MSLLYSFSERRHQRSKYSSAAMLRIRKTADEELALIEASAVPEPANEFMIVNPVTVKGPQ